MSEHSYDEMLSCLVYSKIAFNLVKLEKVIQF